MHFFQGMRQLRMHMLAARGYCVVAIDSRGSQHRGLQFESHLKGRMGTVEIQDQIEVLKWLSTTVDYIDTSRIAIYGWSYGNKQHENTTNNRKIHKFNYRGLSEFNGFDLLS